MSKRTDAHNAVNLITENYEYVNGFDNQQPGWLMSDYAMEISSKVRATNRDRGMSQCHHCGARIRYVAVLEHTPTGDYIAVGETCLQNRFDRATADFQKLRKQAELDRQAQRIKTAVAAFVEANPDLAFMADKDHEHTNDFVADVSRKLRMYGDLSERQVAAVRKSVERDAEYAARKALEEVAPPAGPVPTGRVEIEGKVVGIKWTEDYGYGSTKKLMIQLANGSKVWVSEPAAINTERGDVVVLTCTIEASHDDQTFGFGKRPSKASIKFHNDNKEEAA